jgi:hypothetical protein
MTKLEALTAERDKLKDQLAGMDGLISAATHLAEAAFYGTATTSHARRVWQEIGKIKGETP